MKIKLRNNLRTLMNSRGIGTWSELADRLEKNQALEMDRTSLSRHGNKENPAYALDLIEALCNELQCLPDALFHIDIEDADEQFLENARSRVMPFEFGQVRLRRPAVSDSTRKVEVAAPVSVAEADAGLDEMLGPKVTHLSKAKLTKKQ